MGVSADGRNWNFSVLVSGDFYPSGLSVGKGKISRLCAYPKDSSFLALGINNYYYPVIYRSSDAFNWEVAHNLTGIITSKKFHFPHSLGQPTFVSELSNGDMILTTADVTMFIFF